MLRHKELEKTAVRKLCLFRQVRVAYFRLGIVNKIQVSKITYLDRYMEIRGWRMPLVLTISREWDIIENGYVE